MSNIPGQPDWSENALSLGKPELMDVPTLIEWIQRQLETKEETKARFDEMQRLHEEWHTSGVGAWGIYACCIRVGGRPTRGEQFFQDALDAFKGYNSVLTPNEIRSMKS